MEATKATLRPEDFEIIQNRKSQGDQLVREPVTYWKDAWRRLKKHTGVLSGSAELHRHSGGGRMSLRQHYGLLRRHCG